MSKALFVFWGKTYSNLEKAPESVVAHRGWGSQYPLVIFYIAIENGTFIVYLPIKNGDFFHSYVSLPEGMIIVQFQTRETGELDGMIELLVGGWPTSLKNMSSSVGMMTFPIYGK